MDYDVADMNLAGQGRLRIERADREMRVLARIRERFEKEKPLDGVRIAACLHVTCETANLMITLKAGGAEVRLCASNPLSTQDDVAASLVKDFGIPVFAIKGEDNDTYYKHIFSALEVHPQVTMDDGADLVSALHTRKRELLNDVVGGTEETTTGVIRLKSMAADGVLEYPVVAVNDARTKFMFDNRYGTGQSTIDGILRATNRLLAGSRFVVCGYGWCGRGIAMRARGMGANVFVCEVDPLRALEAVMDGFSVLPMNEAAAIGDIFVTATGDKHVITAEHMKKMKDGAIVCNAGHFNVEIDVEGARDVAEGSRWVSSVVEELTMPSGARIYLLAEGRLVNLSAAEGHPSVVMDMSFANQALCVEYLLKHADSLEKKVYAVPAEIDASIAEMKLNLMGVRIDTLTEEQKNYLASWTEGT